MGTFRDIFQQLVVRTLKQAHGVAVEVAPRVFFFLLILFIGWICAAIFRKVVSKLLRALGFDVLSEKTGLKRFLEKGGITRSPSSLVGLGFYALIILSALMMAFNALGLPAVSQLLRKAVLSVPGIVVGLILITLGVFLSQFLGTLVETASRLANIPFPAALGKAARYAVIGLAVMMALEQLGVATTIIIEAFVIIFGVVPLIAALIFLVGGREIISGALTGRILMKEYHAGDFVEFDSISGEIESVSLLTTKIKSGSGEIIVPNCELIKKVVRKPKRS